jgi:LysR family tcuABC transcriptional regulator
MPTGRQARLGKLGELPLILPTRKHGLRALLDAAFRHAGYTRASSWKSMACPC